MSGQHTAWTSDPAAPHDGDVWDLVVVGGGTAGIVAAKTAAGFGASVLMVERDRPGGDCLWTGCVPSKALIASANAAQAARISDDFGVTVGEVRVDFAAVMARVRRVVGTIEPIDSPDTLRESGVLLSHATARFLGPRSLSLSSGEVVGFRHAIIATGSRPLMPDVPGLTDVAAMTSDDVWDLTALPARLLVLGGGSIGCELAQAFARLGSQVTLVEAAPELLPREDAAAAGLVRSALLADGVEVRLATKIVAAAEGVGGIEVTTAAGQIISADRALVAVGRRPGTDGLGLASAGVAISGLGHVLVDARLRTTNRRIWAAGDVTGHPQFTHVAGVHGSLAASNAVLGLRRRVDTTTIPRVTYTHPEIAAFGVSADAPGAKVVDLHHADVDRAVTDGDTRGLTRLVLDHRRRVIGATVVSPRAGELLGELVVAARSRMRIGELAGTMHPYPGFGDAVWKPAIQAVREQLRRPSTTWLTGRLAAWQRIRHRSRSGARGQR